MRKSDIINYLRYKSIMGYELYDQLNDELKNIKDNDRNEILKLLDREKMGIVNGYIDAVNKLKDEIEENKYLDFENKDMSDQDVKLFRLELLNGMWIFYFFIYII